MLKRPVTATMDHWTRILSPTRIPRQRIYIYQSGKHVGKNVQNNIDVVLEYYVGHPYRQSTTRIVTLYVRYIDGAKSTGEQLDIKPLLQHHKYIIKIVIGNQK